MIKLFKRITLNGNWALEEVPCNCKTFAETIKLYNGKQDWYDKKAHRFTVNGVLYLMSK